VGEDPENQKEKEVGSAQGMPGTRRVQPQLSNTSAAGCRSNTSQIPPASASQRSEASQSCLSAEWRGADTQCGHKSWL